MNSKRNNAKYAKSILSFPELGAGALCFPHLVKRDDETDSSGV